MAHFPLMSLFSPITLTCTFSQLVLKCYQFSFAVFFRFRFYFRVLFYFVFVFKTLNGLCLCSFARTTHTNMLLVILDGVFGPQKPGFACVMYFGHSFFLFWFEFVLGFASIGVGQIVTINVDHLLGRVHISSPKLIFNFMTIMIMMMMIIIILIITNNDDHFVAWLCFSFLCFAVKLHFATTLIVSLFPPLVLCKMLSMFSPHWVPLQPTNQPTTVAQCENFE